MGFKRTAEGRVFFDNSSREEGGGASANANVGDLQIVGLLKALNERLKEAQGERIRLLKDMERYQDTIEELRERTVRSEQAYIDLEQKVSSRQNESASKASRTEQITKEALQELVDTRDMLADLREKTALTEKNFSEIRDDLAARKQTEDLLRKHQLALEKMHKDHNEKIVGSVAAYVALTKRVGESETRFDGLDNKIEEAIASHGRLERKLEKAVEDRGRLLRKIDRIEETVIQTRDALNAKAMVVLADQGLHGLEGFAEQQLLEKDPQPALLEKPAHTGQAWWQRAGLPQAAGVATVLFVALAAGLLLSEVNLKEWKTFDKDQFPFLESGPDAAPEEKTAAQDNEQWQPVTIQDEEVAEAPAEDLDAVEPSEPESPVINQMEVVGDKASDDIGALDLNNEDQLLAALESNPDAVAAKMNEIEPGEVDDNIADTVAAVQPEEKPAAVVEESQKPVVTIKEAVADAVADAKPEMDMTPRPGLTDRIKPDPALTKVVKDIEDQAFAGVPEAQHDLAAIYTAGHGGVKQNYKRASLWFREAAEAGIANARYNLGVLYHQGLGVKQDTAEAIKWYRSAAALGHPEAQYNLGIAYIEGIGVPYDPKKAAGYFKNAADQGITEAAYNLGLIYENALLGKAQPDEALRWYKTAADAGSPEAKAALEQLAKTLKIKLSDVNKLVESIGGTAKPVAKKPAVKAAAAPAKPVEKAVAPEAAPQAPRPVEATVAPVPEERSAVEVTAEDVISAVAPQQDTQRAAVAQVQEYLMQLGLYPGPADGMEGPLTKDAIRSYQLFNDLEDTGEVTEDLLAHMRKDPQITELGSRE